MVAAFSQRFAAKLQRVGVQRILLDRTRRRVDRVLVAREVVVVGPFAPGESGHLLREFPPDRGIDFGARYDQGWREIEWQRAVERRPRSMIRPSDHYFPSSGVGYLATQFRIDEATDAILRLRSGGQLVIRVDGEVVFDDSEPAEYPSLRRQVGLRLGAGWHRVLVKTSAPFALRLTSVDGLPIEGLEQTSELSLRELAPRASEESIRIDAPDDLARWNAELAAIETPAADAETASDAEQDQDGASPAPSPETLHDALDRLGLAILHRSNGRGDLAVDREPAHRPTPPPRPAPPVPRPSASDSPAARRPAGGEKEQPQTIFFTKKTQ